MNYIIYPSIIFGLIVTFLTLIGFHYYIKNNSDIELFTPLYIVISSLSMMIGVVLARLLWQSSISLSISISYIAGITTITFLMLYIYLIKSNKKLKRSIDYKPHIDVDGLIDNGFSEFEKGNYSKAIEYFKMVLSDAKDGNIKIMLKKELAFAYKLSGENDKARNEIKEALEIAKNTGDNSLLELERTLQIM